MEAFETERVNGYVVAVHYDNDSGCWYTDGDHLGHITYRRGARENLGDTPMSSDELESVLYVDHQEDEEWQRLYDVYQACHYGSDEEGVARVAMEAREDELKCQLRPDVIALPVSAYVHSGATIWVGYPGSGGPGTSCPWDSGQSGVVYCTHDEAKDWLRVRPSHWDAELKRTIYDAPRDDSPLTEEEIEQATRCLRGNVEEFDMYLRGDVYGFVIKDDCGEEVESCWGFVGPWKDCMAEAVERAKCLPVLQASPERFRELAQHFATNEGFEPLDIEVRANAPVERIEGTSTAWVQAWVRVDSHLQETE